VNGHDEVIEAWAVIGTFAPESIDQSAIRADDEVTPQLERVLGRASQAIQAIRPKDLHVPAGSLPPPDSTDRAAPQPECLVRRSLGIHQDRKWQAVPSRVRADVGRICERNQDDVGLITQFPEAVAHGDRVGCTRQSMNMAVEDQDHVPAALFSEAPRFAGRVEQ
jgi:hypothetical protein